MKRIILTSAAAAALTIAGLVATAAPAGASNGVTAVTHSAHHADTTSAAGSATQDSPNGAVWAYDNLEEHFTATPDGPGSYHVTIDVTGSFQGFADPRTAAEGSSDPGGPLASAGSVKGTISYEVSSPNAPDKKALPAQMPDGSGLGAALKALFNGNETITAYGPYSFTYNQVGGAPYTQVG